MIRTILLLCAFTMLTVFAEEPKDEDDKFKVDEKKVEQEQAAPTMFTTPELEKDVHLKMDKSKRPWIITALSFGLQHENYSLDAPNSNFNVDASLPRTFLLGFNGEGYFWNRARMGVGGELSYFWSFYRNVLSIDGTPLPSTLDLHRHALDASGLYRFYVTEGKQTLALVAKVGVRYLNFNGNDFTDTTTGVPNFYYAENSYVGLKLSPVNLNYLFPFRPTFMDMGAKFNWDLFLAPWYQEEKYDFDSDGTAEIVSGATADANILNYSINPSFYFIIKKNIIPGLPPIDMYAELGFKWDHTGVGYTGQGNRYQETFSDATSKENYFSYYLSIGWILFR